MKYSLHIPRLRFLFATTLASLLLCCATLSGAAETVEKWGRYEIELEGPTTGNPFIDVHLSATFTNGYVSKEVAGFYDGDGVYRIRFLPEAEGDWRYVTSSNVWSLANKKGDFTVAAPTDDNRGPVSVYNTYHFAYADGTPFKQVGTTCYTWTHRPEAMEESTLATLAKSPFNKLRMCVFPQTHGTKTTPPTRFPFEGPGTDPDYTRFNPDFFQHLEMRIGQLQELGIECDLILFHPYDDDHVWGLDSMDPETEDRYLRYIVARLSSYRNIWWSMANEYDFVRNKTEADWDRIFQVVQAADPYDHLRSIHNGRRIYDHNKPWVTHVSMQNGQAVDNVFSAELYRGVYQKPIVYDEIEYEGDYKSRWAQLSGEEMVHRFWAGTVAGTYVGHSELFAEPGDPGEEAWLGQGVALKGTSVPRMAFLREILEESPKEGLNPIDAWHWDPSAGQPGEYYLFYFGREAPQSWAFSLYKEGMKEGLRFRAEVIDAWNMTITPVEGLFETVKKDGYHYVDKHGRSIELKGKPYQAIRLRRVD